QAPEMRRKTRVLDLAKEFRLERAVESPAVDQQREQRPPSPCIPLAVEEFALLLYRLQRQQPLDLARPVHEHLHHFHDCADEQFAHAASERAATDGLLA